MMTASSGVRSTDVDDSRDDFQIDPMKGRSEAVALADEIDHSEESGYLPAPALFELWLGAGRSARGRKEIRKIETLIESFDVIMMTQRTREKLASYKPACLRLGGRWGQLTSCWRESPAEEARSS